MVWFRKIGHTNTVGLEKVVRLVPGRKVKVLITTSRAAAGGSVEARVVTPGRMQRNKDTDCAIIVAKDKFDRSQNGALDQGVKPTQHYDKQLGKVHRYSSL